MQPKMIDPAFNRSVHQMQIIVQNETLMSALHFYTKLELGIEHHTMCTLINTQPHAPIYHIIKKQYQVVQVMMYNRYFEGLVLRGFSV